MKISVIIPTYKPQDYLWECLDSLVRQTISKDDYEVILVLNGCGEPWKSLIQEYIDNQMQDLQVNFIQTDFGGVSNARNLALNVAQGEYVTFIDDDDFVSDTFLEELYEIATPDTISLCYPYAFIDGDMSQIPYSITHAYEKLSVLGRQLYPRSRKYFSGPWMKLLHKSFIQGKKFDVRFSNGEDSLFMFLCSDRFSYVNYTSVNAIYYRRIRENSACTKKRSIKAKFLNGCLLIAAYTEIYLKDIMHYSLSFYFTRILGTCRAIFH